MSEKLIKGIPAKEYNKEYMKLYRERNRDKYNEYYRNRTLLNCNNYEEQILKLLNKYADYKKKKELIELAKKNNKKLN